MAPDEWSAETHALAAGDFNSDGRGDLLVKAYADTDVSGIVLSDSSGVATLLHQTWTNDYLGIAWDGDSFLAHAGDFDGDGNGLRRADLVLQGLSGADTHALIPAKCAATRHSDTYR